jgi:hypothetical protein
MIKGGDLFWEEIEILRGCNFIDIEERSSFVDIADLSVLDIDLVYQSSLFLGFSL